MPEYILETDEELDARENEMRELLSDSGETLDDFEPEPDDHADDSDRDGARHAPDNAWDRRSL